MPSAKAPAAPEDTPIGVRLPELVGGKYSVAPLDVDSCAQLVGGKYSTAPMDVDSCAHVSVKPFR